MAERSNLKTLIAITVAIALGAFVSWAGSDGGARFNQLPVFALCGVLAFAINWLAYIPSAMLQTERCYDLVGGITYITVVVIALVLSGEPGLRASLVAAMVITWSLRLASFLFMRISRSGTDSRFDEIKTQPLRFFLAWTLQGLWVVLTAATALAVITGGAVKPMGTVGIVGVVVWSVGMLIEIIADEQKSRFKKLTGNEGKFINTGLWAWSRHPNYFGEIVLWLGMAIVAVPVLQGWQWVTLVSPVFVWFLLTRVSGIPLLEKKADKKWGSLETYKNYKNRTPLLVPKPPGTQS